MRLTLLTNPTTMKLLHLISQSLESKLWRTSLILTALVSMPMLSFLPADADITGKVFRDFNGNGILDTGITGYTENGVPGVTVTAYNATGVSVASVVTATDGSYALTAGTGEFRIEFTGLATGDFPSAYGTGNGTTIQFASSGATNVNLGVNYPAQYSATNNPKAITSGFVSGNQSGSTYNVATLWGVSFAATGSNPDVANMGTAAQYGSVWGTAFSKSKKDLYTAAFTKRYVGFGPQGSGAIYITKLSGTGFTTAGAPALFYKFTDAEVGGSAETLHGTLGTSAGDASYDAVAFDNVGKTSLGDIELSEDEKELYVVNLYDRTLNIINVASKLKTATVAIPNPTSGSTYRPFALRVYRGKVYVGVVVTNETSYNETVYNSETYRTNKGNSTGMKAVVYEFSGGAFNTAPVLDFPLTYKKQPTSADQTGDTPRGHFWRPWTSTYREDREANLATYSQPWLTSIDFDVNGDMILALRDRFGDQMGYSNRRPNGNVGPGGQTPLVSVIATGDILRAGKSGNSWTIENHGSVNGSVASSSQLAQFGPGSTTTAAGKYYYGDVVAGGGNHGASTLGGVTVLPGSGRLVMTAMDPIDAFNQGGIKRLVNTTGAADGTSAVGKGAVLYNEGVINWGKANGMGDVELLTEAAPIEIGNRVWQDSNGNGIQDAGEPGIAGVTVQLVQGGNVIATAVTDSEGRYIFSNKTGGTATESFIYGIAELKAEEDYTVRIQNVSGNNKQSALNALLLTKENRGDATDIGDERDSDGVAAGTSAEVAFTTGLNGQNNHSYDFGFSTEAALPVVLIDFKAKDSGEKTVNLIWVTTSETNSAYFEVQKSTDGKSWSSAGTIVDAKGESVTSQTYHFTDTAPLNGQNFYRLKLVDRDGTFGYSRLESVVLKGIMTLNVYPNPTVDNFKIATASGIVVTDVSIYSGVGRLVMEVKNPAEREIDIKQLPQGAYVVKMVTKDGVSESRTLIIRK